MYCTWIFIGILPATAQGTSLRAWIWSWTSSTGTTWLLWQHPMAVGFEYPQRIAVEKQLTFEYQILTQLQHIATIDWSKVIWSCNYSKLRHIPWLFWPGQSCKVTLQAKFKGQLLCMLRIGCCDQRAKPWFYWLQECWSCHDFAKLLLMI